MMKFKTLKNLAVLFTALIAFVTISCSCPMGEAIDSPAAVLSSIVIGEEVLLESNNGGARTALSDLQENSDEAPLWLQSSSRGTICLFFLKYGLSRHPALQTKDDFGKVIEWGKFKNDTYSYGEKTEKYLKEYWNDIKTMIDNFDMGKLSVNKTDDGKYVVIQVDPGMCFMHYIVLTPTTYGTYDIDFYGIEIMGPKPDVYYEQTKFTSTSDFSVKRFYYDVPDSIHSFDDVKENVSSIINEQLSSIFDFSGKKMHGLQRFSFIKPSTYEESFTDFVYAAKKDSKETRYGVFRNNGTLVLGSECGYAVNFLEGTADITDNMTQLYEDTANKISCVCLKPEYVGPDKDFKCTVSLDTTYLDAELEKAKNLESRLLNSAEGLSVAVNGLSDAY